MNASDETINQLDQSAQPNKQEIHAKLPPADEVVKLSEVENRYPNGFLIYGSVPGSDREQLQRVLQAAIPGRMVVVTGPLSIFPNDTGMQIGDTVYGYTIHKSLIEDALQTRISVPENSDFSDELQTHLPPMVPGGRTNPEGGITVPLYNTDIVIRRRWKKNNEIVSQFTDAGLQVVEPEVFEEYIYDSNQKEKDDGIPKDEQFHFGHIDFYLTGGLDKRTQQIKLFVDVEIAQSLANEVSQTPELNRAEIVSIDHEKVLKGALNITIVDGIALIPSKNLVGEELYDYLQINCDRVCELGEDQYFGRGSIKCRSYQGTWKK